MSILAIKGPATRGKEVIEILEMLGGKVYIKEIYKGQYPDRYYFINKNEGFIGSHFAETVAILNAFQTFTLEEFLEMFPYKIGDKVLYKYGNTPYFIRKMFWEIDKVLYELSDEVYSDGSSLPDTLIFDVGVAQLQPYKEETMEIPEKLMPKIDFNEYCKDKYILDLGNYEIKEENGKTYAVRKWLEYPKTYEECCKIIDYRFVGTTIIGYKADVLRAFQKLLICRNAYWKIAGEQMGLGKPWKPDWNHDTEKYVIYPYQYLYSIDKENYRNTILAFPTEEMRDAFYENFKDLIEQCKELL